MSEKKIETMLQQIPDQITVAPPLFIEAAGQRLKQTDKVSYLGGTNHKNADLSLEIDQRTSLMQACVKRFGSDLYDRITAPLGEKARMLKADVIETLLYGCVTCDHERGALCQRWNGLLSSPVASHWLPAPTLY